MIEEPKYYYSNGKLLITGEYLILKGALSLAMPVKFGQSIQIIDNSENKNFIWETNIKNTEWFNCRFNSYDLSISETSDIEKAIFLQTILKSAVKLNPESKAIFQSKKAISNINFNIDWGLGSSSSLISNIAYLFNIDAYDLHFSVTNGSGYDIACARAKTALLYQINEQKPTVNDVIFEPDFKSQLYFLYLGKKQNSSKSVKQFLKNDNKFLSEVKSISEISAEILAATSLIDFNYLISEHNKILSFVLNQKNIKNDFFTSFEGQVKSLGAWGGDFAIISSKWEKARIEKYFKSKALSTLISFDEMKLKNQ